MIKVLLLLSFLCISTFSFESPIEYIANIQLNDIAKDISTLIQHGFAIDDVKKDTKTAEVYIGEEHEFQLLDKLEFKYDAQPNPVQFLRSKRDTTSDSYHNYQQLTDFLNGIVATYPNISQIFTAGKSVQGRELWGIRISDNIAVNEAEPQFKYVANMHGDEVVGREMTIYLIDLLCSNYNKDSSALSQRITRLVNNVDIYIIPSMNPDGYERGTRGNANNKDLNRDFPDQFTSPINTITGRQPETAAIMQWTQQHNFVLSANYHGGAVVANYAFDGNKDMISGQYSAAPDDAVFKRLAHTYANAHTTMHNSWEFTNGITNGAEWYVLYGGMQDWNYLWNGVFEITLEISDDKHPPAATLPTYWTQNKEAMLTYMELVLSMGVRGLVLDSVNNAPLPANITVSGINHTIKTNPLHGDYYRLLAAGSYTITASATGYVSQSFNVQITDSQAEQVVHNFYLSKH